MGKIDGNDMFLLFCLAVILILGIGCEQRIDTEGTYTFEVACSVEEVQAALAIMGEKDSIRHAPCTLLEDEQMINALYEHDMRSRQ